MSTGAVDPPGSPPAPKKPGTFNEGNPIGKETRWKKGESGNPDGIPKGMLSVRQLENKSREYCAAAIDFWATIMLDVSQPIMARVRCSEDIAAYGMGRPRQAITVSGEEGKPPVQVDAVSALLERMITTGAEALANAQPNAAQSEAITVEGRLIEATPEPQTSG